MGTRERSTKSKADAKSKKNKSKTTVTKTKKTTGKKQTATTAATSSNKYALSPKEVENGQKVLAILESIDEIGYTVHRPDLFTVIEPEFGLEITVDAEEEIICLVAEICDRSHLEQNVPDWAAVLLELNNTLLHGAFTLHESTVLLRENLAAENLDANELEDALSAMFVAILRHGHTLKLL